MRASFFLSSLLICSPSLAQEAAPAAQAEQTPAQLEIDSQQQGPQQHDSPQPGPQQPDASSAKPAPSAQRSAASESALLVSIQLQNSQLSEEQILSALHEEFQLPITEGAPGQGLQIHVQHNHLHAEFIDTNGQKVSRDIELPAESSHQLTSIALLSGSIARDAAGSLLRELDAKNKQAAPASKETALSEEPTATATDSAPATKAKLPHTPASVSVFGPLALPTELKEKKTSLELGLFYSDLGSLSGLGINLLALRNRGADQAGSGQGLQIASLYTSTQGNFRGLNVTGIFAHSQEKLQGASITGLVNYHQGDLQGAQIAALSNVTQGNTKGLQLSVIGSYSKQLKGAQISLVPVTQELSGAQIGIVSVSQKKLKGFQLGVINYGGDFEGTQIGLINIAHRGKGTQLGLLNIDKELKGSPIAPLNIIPGIRNQLVGYVSYTPTDELEGLTRGPLYHLGWRFFPDPIYTQIALGIGAEQEECPDGNAGACYGGGVTYAPSFAVGVHSAWNKLFYSDVDLQYQFEKGFNDSRSSRHAVLGRLSLGMQLSKAVAAYVGGGPRFDVYEGPRLENSPDLGMTWHAFGGMSFF